MKKIESKFHTEGKRIHSKLCIFNKCISINNNKLLQKIVNENLILLLTCVYLTRIDTIKNTANNNSVILTIILNTSSVSFHLTLHWFYLQNFLYIYLCSLLYGRSYLKHKSPSYYHLLSLIHI